MFNAFGIGKNQVRKLNVGIPGNNKSENDQIKEPNDRRTISEDKLKITKTVIEDLKDLPEAIRMFGSEKKEAQFTEKYKGSMGALIHEDNSATIIVTEDGEKLSNVIRGFQELINTIFARLNTSLIVNVTVLAGAYEHYSNKTIKEPVKYQMQSQIKSFTLNMINQAIEMNASDIHIEIRQGEKKSAAIRFRIDGDMELIKEYKDSEITLPCSIASFLFQGDYADDSSRSNAQASDRVEQHASIRIPELKNVAIRYQTFLDKEGYDIILRILTFDGKSQGLLDLQTMGFEPDQIEMMIKAVSSNYGASFLGGSTGSGKTTTMAGVMNADQKKLSRKRLTIEDPVEIDLSAVTQCSIQRSANDTSSEPFIKALKAALRSDPDLVMIGEIRERATANLMIDMAIAGHNIWGTLHINRMFDALYRLTADSIGIPASVIGSGNLLNLLNAQTLVKTLCPKCKIPLADGLKKELIDKRQVMELKQFNLDTNDLFLANKNSDNNKNDCDNCKGKGELGRTVCAEMVLVTDEMKEFIAKGEFEKAEQTYRKSRTTDFGEDGMMGKTFLDHAMLKAQRGIVSALTIHELSGDRLTGEYQARKYRGYINND